MSKKKRDLTADEQKLWRRVATGIKARRTQPPASDDDEPTPAPLKRRQSVPQAETAAPRSKSPSTPQNRSNERRVRRGKLEIGGKLDLHGHTQASGRAALGGFLYAAQRRGDRTVVVITGVGRGGEGVLKQRLPSWLAEPDIASLVSGFAPAHRSHGGAGAFYVFLKRSTETSA